ncbi:hypothetical protein KUTeg_013564 [Tegillarca granosa]|uniref:TNF receptor-associated factor 3 n=2 Tax=Tegillarca granosa TaxID=220873 RepID=A0ABQ9EU46_TEGGR|nr:hypothetical protein KUTeg_013564 [Tegillarca granosa]
MDQDFDRNEAHEDKACQFKPVECPFKGSGCQEKFLARNQEQHILNCTYKPTECMYCKLQIPVYLKQKHETEDCIKYPISCNYNCGTTSKLPRDEMVEHMRQCPKKPQECPFKIQGCEFMGTNAEVQEHIKNATDQHLQMITMYTANIDLQSLEIRRQLQNVVSDRDQSQHQLVIVRQEVEDVKADAEGIKQGVKDVKLKIVAQTERIILLERKFEELATKSAVDVQSRDINILKESLTSMTERVTQLERTGLSGGVGTLSQAVTQGGGGGAGLNQDVSRIQNNLLTQIQQHDRQIGIQDIRMAELDLRFQVLETASYDGVLMWKIRDYSRRKQEAITGRTLSLYSQPFYTHRFGYKMCARVYLNGDGMGKGTHLSLFFVIMKGEYDALLKWPFEQHVTLMLLDQDSGQRHLSDSFRPDPTSSSFKRPTTEMNIASGCPLFVSHAVLETRTYIVDDTLFIKVDVSTEGLVPP